MIPGINSRYNSENNWLTPNEGQIKVYFILNSTSPIKDQVNQYCNYYLSDCDFPNKNVNKNIMLYYDCPGQFSCIMIAIRQWNHEQQHTNHGNRSTWRRKCISCPFLLINLGSLDSDLFCRTCRRYCCQRFPITAVWTMLQTLLELDFHQWTSWCI